ncbi:hypothetical protein K491DRAFT_199754 [Lophiostoma macrostomum CBS 122681]|uniref:Uncharacterized protein n=1 Tax=Lophiostoma macrostomum CBS 122681 TaxID=1314788 RepID=A0A6A6SP59_9PLEO|nr:hypothetical protein K491DRAFT_199754 [Lophiostoma macrostomum CBS 122681]
MRDRNSSSGHDAAAARCLDRMTKVELRKLLWLPRRQAVTCSGSDFTRGANRFVSWLSHGSRRLSSRRSLTICAARVYVRGCCHLCSLSSPLPVPLYVIRSTSIQRPHFHKTAPRRTAASQRQYGPSARPHSSAPSRTAYAAGAHAVLLSISPAVFPPSSDSAPAAVDIPAIASNGRATSPPSLQDHFRAQAPLY